jgi:hypothetical protein
MFVMLNPPDRSLNLNSTEDRVYGSKQGVACNDAGQRCGRLARPDA